MASGYPLPKNHQWETHPKSISNSTSTYIQKPATLADMFNSQFFLGFQEQVERWNSLTSTKAVTFPPYNLIKTDDDHYTVELAVAGYAKEDIEITVEKDLLTVKSVATEEKTTATVLHQGIAKRQWSQNFVLGEWFSVKGASITDGLLTITVERELPEELKPKVIEIK